ncbi:hypothetical protein DID88_003063 [Monilinia fructigena]|uniref:ABC transporter domain-containing protein n=1 Tax=Monilinia fructigena TaxID=38457 RepID=A0A395IES7_9HELO|nr:hypothetical protein DID88_003063 [Monilinia fructigena]
MTSTLDPERNNYFPERSDSILNDEAASSQHHDKVVQAVSNTSGSSANFVPSLRPSRTNETAREKQFEEVTAGDRQELRRIATSFEGSQFGRTLTNATGGDDELEKQNTLTGVKLGDSTLDPSSPDFDVIRWTKMMMRLVCEKQVAQRRAGIVFKNLKVCGSGSAINVQKNVSSLLMAPLRFREFVGKGPEKTILNEFNGVLKSGEMLIVLGRPGSGCSTLLKTLMGELYGLDMKPQSDIHYNGITQKQMLKQFRGEIVYNQEVDKHFPHLTVGETLEFAASSRTPQQRLIDGTTRAAWAKHMTKVVMAVFGLSHTYNTKVGNDFVRGISGGERKRVSIAEMALAGSPISSWDNSTRGLDAATALEFTKSLRMTSNLCGSCHLVAIHQASQQIYDQFDKAVVLYEGRQIYFGPCGQAKQYFVDMGWECPRTPEEFEKYFKDSAIYKRMMNEIKEHEEEFPMGGKTLDQFKASRKDMQANHLRPESPYTVSMVMQTKYCAKRAVQRLWNDKTSTVTTIVGQIVMAFIIGSMFYDTPDNTSSFFQKGGVLFFAVLLNALMAISEINTLYSQRPIVEKQASYAFYHPFTEALAGVVVDIPVKFAIAICFNLILYFLSGLKRESDAFFIFFLFNFLAILTMSQIYRSIAAATKTVSQALAIAGVVTLAIVIYTGFIIPRPLMHPWFKWISWINPVAYAFEALFGPAIFNPEVTFICAVAGATVGSTTVNGEDYLQAQFQYSYSHIWRNLGFMFAFLIFFLAFYLLVTELNASTVSKAGILVFRRGYIPGYLLAAERAAKNDEEAHVGTSESAKKTTVLTNKEMTTSRHWHLKLKYSLGKMFVMISRLRTNLADSSIMYPDGVKPGALTALMGVSGAGKNYIT